METRARRLFWTLLMIAALAPASSLADTYDTATLVNITTTGKEDVRFLYDNRIDIVGLQRNVYKALLTDEQIRMLSEKGLAIEILYAEMQEDRTRWAQADASYGLTTSYYTASKFNTTNPPSGSLMEHLRQLYNAHPDVTRLYNLGATQDGAYDVIAMKVTKNPDTVEAEPKIRIYGNIHGDEKGGLMVSCDVLDTILAGYTAVPQDATARKLVDESEIWFIPMGNPYGNATNSRFNSRAVDLNRNFWGPAGSDAPPAWSEKETQIIRDLTEAATADHSKKRFALSLSFHEGETVFNSVWNYTTAAPSDEPIFWSSRTGGTGCGAQTIPNCPTIAPHGLAKAYQDGCTTPGFWYTEGYDWYGTRGDTNDWAYGAWTALDTTLELNGTKTPSPDQIPIYTAQHRQAVLNYMMKVFQGIHGVMTDQNTGAPLDGTVTAIATASASIPVPHVYQAVFTDPVAGDFHRVLQPGTYTVICNAPGYAPTTITDVVVTADNETYADCDMNRTGLAYSSSSIADSCSGGGAYSGDGILDAGEEADLPVSLGNPGSLPATSVQGTLSTTAPGITITRSTASFADVPGGGTGASSAPHFRIRVGAGAACGSLIPFNLHMTSTQGAWDDSFTVPVGQIVPPQTLLAESFDATTFPPTGWAQVDVSGTSGNWARATGTVNPTGGGTHSGAGLAYFNSFTSVAGRSTRLYRTSGVAIPASAASASMTFWMYHDTGDSTLDDRVQVQVSTNGTTWSNAGSAVSRYDGSTGWKQHTIPLNAYIGQSGIQVAFLGISARGNDCHIDDVQVTYAPQIGCIMHACEAAPSADLVATMSGPSSEATNGNIGYALGVTNNGPTGASNVQLDAAIPAATTFVSLSAPGGWSCTSPAVGATGPVTCTATTLAASEAASFTLVVKVDWCAGNGTTIVGSASASTSTSDPSAANNFASASTTVVDSGSCDDGNPCTIADGCSGGACAGIPEPPPGEVDDGVRVAKNGVQAADIGWNLAAGATLSDVLRGLLSALPVGPGGGDETCIASGIQGTTFTDADDPAGDDAFWYLVRGVSSCGKGTYGFQGSGGAPSVPRVSPTCP